MDLIDDFLRIQSWQIDQCLKEMRWEFQQSWGERPDDPISGWFLFTQNIQDELILINFYLQSLEAFNGNIDLIEYTVAFRA